MTPTLYIFSVNLFICYDFILCFGLTWAILTPYWANIASYNDIKPDWPTAAAALGSSNNPASYLVEINDSNYYLPENAHTPLKSESWLTSRVWSLGDSVSLIDNDINNSWVNFCLPNATAPLVTKIHSRPSRWHSAT